MRRKLVFLAALVAALAITFGLPGAPVENAAACNILCITGHHCCVTSSGQQTCAPDACNLLCVIGKHCCLVNCAWTCC